jgi:ribose transport system ATP-binding protein
MSVVPVISVEGVSKSFTSTKALNDVSFQVGPGEIRGLIGENGSGKSTLSSIIAGNLQPDRGRMFLLGKEYIPKDSFEASERGVSMIVQEQGTIATISAAANIFAGRESQFCRLGVLNQRELNRAAATLLARAGASSIPPEAIAGMLSLESRKLVELARALYKTPELFIVDETTTALSQKGRSILYGIIRELKAAGKAVVFISHDIDELISICDSVTILRDGVFVDTLPKERMVPRRLKTLMVGREISDNYYRTDFNPGGVAATAMIVESVSCGVLKDVSFTIRKGEILGIAGLTDSGMHELARTMFGLTRPDRGQVKLGDGTVIDSPSTAIAHKVGFVSKNRDMEAILSSACIRDNIVLPCLGKLQRHGIITHRSERSLAGDWADQLKIKMRSLRQACSELSGGNKQKVVLAKWLANDTRVFILDCPTRGIDVGVKESIYRIMEDLKEKGCSIVMVSEELAEVIGMSDRILTLKDGRISGVFARSADITEAAVIQYMI